MKPSRRIRVLWFCHSLSYSENNGVRHLRLPSWVDGLKDLFEDNPAFQLSIAFLCDKGSDEKFNIGGIDYYPVSNGLNNSWKKWRFKIQHKIGRRENVTRSLDIVSYSKPDLIQIFGTEFEFPEIISSINTPVLVHIQSIIQPYFLKWFGSGFTKGLVFRKSGIMSLVKGSGVFHAYYRFKKQFVREIQFYKNIQYFTGRTNWDFQISKMLAPGSQYYHCDEILRNAFYASEPVVYQKAAKRIITIINPNLYKGLEVIFWTAEILSKAGHVMDWTVVGFSENADIVKITEAFTKVKSRTHGIKFLVPDSEENLVALMRSGDLYVHPSHIENSSNAVCEAMMLGMPVICSNVGGSSTLIEHSVDGLLFPAGDAYYLASEIIRILSDLELRSTIGSAARETALYRHDRKRVGELLVNIYSKILNDV